MRHWLFEQISNHDNDRKPSFSVNAIANWYRALKFEIERVHGRSVNEQIESCRDFYNEETTIKPTKPTEAGEVFEHLFFSIVYCMTIERFASELRETPWIRPTAIVDWYYAIYFSFRSMVSIFGHLVSDDHSKTAKFMASTFRTHLTYPFDMLARRVKGEEYDVILNDHTPHHYSLNNVFTSDIHVAQDMLAQYIRGTAAWNAERTKAAILREKKLNNFRSKQAQLIRDSRLISEIGFLHCAYRQRTKANYRDAIYLSYNYGDDVYLDTFIYNLSVSAKFASIAAIACAERKVGQKTVKSFANDLLANIRGIDIAKTSEKYWAGFC